MRRFSSIAMRRVQTGSGCEQTSSPGGVVGVLLDLHGNFTPKLIPKTEMRCEMWLLPCAHARAARRDLFASSQRFTSDRRLGWLACRRSQPL
eukprot:1031502-Prymnesium_polylepis.1